MEIKYNIIKMNITYLIYTKYISTFIQLFVIISDQMVMAFELYC
jgi:hypothetical protein